MINLGLATSSCPEVKSSACLNIYNIYKLYAWEESEVLECTPITLNGRIFCHPLTLAQLQGKCQVGRTAHVLISVAGILNMLV